jgi:hypothetical protein
MLRSGSYGSSIFSSFFSDFSPNILSFYIYLYLYTLLVPPPPNLPIIPGPHLKAEPLPHSSPILLKRKHRT